MRINMRGKYLTIITAVLILTGFACSPKYRIAQNKNYSRSVSDSINPDSSIIRMYMPYKLGLEKEMNEVIAIASAAFTKPNSPETTLGNLYADAMLSYSRKLDPSIDFTFSNKGGLRNNISAGNILVSTIFEMMPFENELVLLELKGTDVQKLLNFIASTGGQPVAGMRMKIVDKKAADVLIADKPFDINRTYKVITSDYIADGGDKFDGLASPVSRKKLNVKVRDALMQYVKEHKTLQAITDGRITD